MLRNISRAVSSKQALMADHNSQSSPNQNCNGPISSFFGSSRFRAFMAKGVLSETDAAMVSPTSILDNRPFSLFRNPFYSDRNQPKSPKAFPGNKHTLDNSDAKGVGLALIDSLNNETIEKKNNNSSSKPTEIKGGVLFSSNLRVEIPHLALPTFSPTESPNISAEFTKTSAPDFKGCVRVNEMELSEEFTCVISHGTNPRTTHIFNDCIVDIYSSFSDKSNPSSMDFLSFCYTCKRNLDPKNDIYIYRGEKAFCSHECRYQEMVLDAEENSEFG